jgi:hypothetical protein
MPARLSEEQRRAVEERGGAPIDVVDTETNARYVLLRAEQFEALKAANGGEEAEALYPLLADIEPDDWEDSRSYDGRP